MIFSIQPYDRCANYLDTLNGSDYENAGFGSSSCRVFDVEWATECPSSQTVGDYHKCALEKNLINNNTACSECNNYEYSPNNTFTETATE